MCYKSSITKSGWEKQNAAGDCEQNEYSNEKNKWNFAFLTNIYCNFFPCVFVFTCVSVFFVCYFWNQYRKKLPQEKEILQNINKS